MPVACQRPNLATLTLFVAAIAVAGCGEVVKAEADASPQADAAPQADGAAIDAAAATTCENPTGANTIFLNTNGGTYTMSPTTSPLTNESQIVQMNGTVSGWQVPAATKAAMTQCLAEVLRRYNVRITDVEPTTLPYHEIVVTSSTSDSTLFPFPTPSIGQLGCTPLDTSITFVFTNFSENPLTICRSAASMLGFTQGLSRVMPVCEDTMTFTYECPNQLDFFDGNQTCGNNMDPVPCACSQMAIQNSHTQLTAALGACPD